MCALIYVQCIVVQIQNNDSIWSYSPIQPIRVVDL